MSLKFLDYLIEDNKLWPVFTKEGLGKRDLTFIKEIIIVRPLNSGKEFQGRGPNKHFLYEVVDSAHLILTFFTPS